MHSVISLTSRKQVSWISWKENRILEVPRRIINRRKMYLASETHLLFHLEEYKKNKERKREREIQILFMQWPFISTQRVLSTTIIPWVPFFCTKLPPEILLSFILPLLNVRGESGYCWHGRYNAVSKNASQQALLPLTFIPCFGGEASGSFVLQYGQSIVHSPRTSLLPVRNPPLAKINERGNGAWGLTILFSLKLRT